MCKEKNNKEFLNVFQLITSIVVDPPNTDAKSIRGVIFRKKDMAITKCKIRDK